MTKQIKSMSLTNKLTLAAFLTIALTNPVSVGYIGSGVDTAVIYFTLYAHYGLLAGMALLGGLNIYHMWASRQRVNLPPKTSKRKTTNKVIADLDLVED